MARSPVPSWGAPGSTVTCGGLRNDPAAIRRGTDPTARENVAAISGRRSAYHRVAPPRRRGLRPWVVASPAGIGIAGGANGGLARPGPAVTAPAKPRRTGANVRTPARGTSRDDPSALRRRRRRRPRHRHRRPRQRRRSSHAHISLPPHCTTYGAVHADRGNPCLPIRGRRRDNDSSHPLHPSANSAELRETYRRRSGPASPVPREIHCRRSTSRRPDYGRAKEMVGKGREGRAAKGARD